MDDAATRLAFVGTYSDDVFGCRIDGETGELEALDGVPTGENPSFLALHPSGDYLYAICETDPGEAVTFAVDRERGTLDELARAPTGDAGPAHCAVDPSGECLLVAHYHGGSVAMLPIDDEGRAGEAIDVVEHEGSSVDPARQTEPHPHAIAPDPDRDVAYVPDLGTDEVVTYGVDREAGRLRRRDAVAIHDGAGPRHVACHPDGGPVYLVNELDSTLTTLRRGDDGLRVGETVGTLPDDFAGTNHPAGVHVHPDGDRVYASNRGHDSLAVFELDDEGTPTLAGHASVGGETPRAFAVTPDGGHVVVANQESDGLVTLRVEGTGLSETGHAVEVPAPSRVAFVPRP
jgi:6-phosphogluconolactonase